MKDVDAFARDPYILHFKPHNTGQSLHIAYFGYQRDDLILSLYMLCVSGMSEFCLRGEHFFKESVSDFI